MNRITRVEVIDENGRSYVNWEDDNNVSWQFQDNGKTLKVFVNKVKSKSPVEEAYKRWMGEYPPTTPSVSNYEDNRWSAFQAGYNALQGDYEVGEYLKPHTPEQTEKSLREAFQKAQQTEEWKETQRKIDAPKESWMNKPVEELVAILEKNPPDCLRFELSPSLEDRIYKWWETCFVHHPEWSMEECAGDLLDIIELYLPRFQSAAGSQSLGVEDLVEGFNDCLKKIKSKLRNKDTP